MILFAGILMLIDGIWSLYARHNKHHPECPWYYDGGRIFRAAVGILLIAAALVLQIDCGIAWAEEGSASWYDFRSCRREGTSGFYSATGERFNELALTCAMPDRKMFGRYIRITNLRNGKTVVCRVNDFGPAKKLVKKGRIIDLSRGAFLRIASLKEGVIKVKIEKL